MEDFKEDVVLGEFITYMDLVLEHVKIDYLKKLRKINYYEEELNEDKKYKEFEFVIDESEYVCLDKLNKKEKQLIELLYIKGFSYKEISTMTKETIAALEKRRYRAILKIKKNLEE